MSPELELIAERVAHLKELVELRDQLNERAVKLIAAESGQRLANIIAIASVAAALAALMLRK